MIRILVLVENLAKKPGVLAEHGLAYWVETGTHRVLFDTGQGLALEANARRLGVDLGTVDAIVLSHGHYDHVGGLPRVLELAPRARLYLHPRAKETKYTGSGGKVRRISTEYMENEAFAGGWREVCLSKEPREVVPGVWMSGEIPRRTDYEDTGGPFFLDPQLTVADPLWDDQALFLPTREGLVVLLGCSHAGAINTLRHVESLSGERRLRLVLGGLHLENASPRRLQCTLDALAENPALRQGFCHCTGLGPAQLIRARFPESWTQVYSGAEYILED